MATFTINGGKSLSGTVPIGGSKNTVLPLIAACLLTEEPCTLEGVPTISDVRTMLAIAEGLGAKISWDESAHRIEITAKSLTNTKPDPELARKLRGSILFAGALLGRFRNVVIPYPGGDAIGARPLVTHFRALQALGASVEENEYMHITGAKLAGADLTLEESSVTATENTILASVLLEGTTTIRLAALEPHVQELVAFLRKMGADIRWENPGRIVIRGVKRLGGAMARVNPDEQEISSFGILAALSASAIRLGPVVPDYLDAVLLQFRKMGLGVSLGSDAILTITPAGRGYKSFRVQAGLYPKLGSDHLPPFAVLATQAEGASLIHDWIYEDRFRYIPELQKMGANCRILDPHRAVIEGPCELSGTKIESLDIRAGMTVVIAAIIARGRSVISEAEHLDRGYEALEERLQGLGADITRS